MASRFSGVLQLTDLDDFIAPSQVNYVCNLGRKLCMNFRIYVQLRLILAILLRRGCCNILCLFFSLTEVFAFTGMY